MPTNTTEQPLAKTSNKKTVASDINRMLEEAPLFAGLDGYILRQAEKVTTGTKKKVAKEKKKSSDSKQLKPSVPKKSPPHNSPDVQKPFSGDMLLSVTEMCTLLKISRATLVRMDKSGQLPGRIKLGGSVRFHRETVEAWLQSLISVPSTAS